ncbi:hypothetical protein ZOSMA_61G00140 [Zostera marina]|uniref:Uncharacterized protein n=1 Tax=Zostera marina TaxID=29655 RepID=A0A0K9NTT2_ZOSMR|nr:hypothetical protein ZOSMA_61G00140 [Zostera marina]
MLSINKLHNHRKSNTMATILICSPRLIELPRPSFSSASPSRILSTRKTRTVVCNASIDRRDMLISLGGLYSAASSGLIMPRQTIAAPIESPDLSTCKKSMAELDENIVTIEPTCCPPYSDKIVDFCPTTPSRIRVRPAVQNMTNDQIAKYKEAIKRMRALDKEDPRSFMQQANIHCAYCNNAYDQASAYFFTKL